MKIVDRISVRSLVEFVLRSGDIESGFTGAIRANLRALEGTRLHQKLQKKAMSDESAAYQKEVLLSLVSEYPFGGILVEGRADGIFRTPEGLTAIDEIKSTTAPLGRIDLDTFPLHLAQAKCYGHMYLQDHQDEELLIQISYVHAETEEVKRLSRVFTREELSDFYTSVMDLYRPWIEWHQAWLSTRDQSLSSLEFPYESFRPGQRTMAAYIYRMAEEGGKLFLQAPTGIGKTLSAMYPSLRFLGSSREDGIEKIFYLTAKNVTKTAARDAVRLLSERSGLRLKTLVLTAKDRICPLEKRDCRPEPCRFARGHYDRVGKAALSVLEDYDLIDDAVILEAAGRHQVCPFELSLDIATWADMIVCDYNYVFDPSASLKRFFQEGSSSLPYLLLIDEAHNLVDRARDMFSAELSKKELGQIRKLQEKKSPLYKSIGKVNTLLLEAGKRLKEESGEKRGESLLLLDGMEEGFEEKFYFACMHLSQAMGEVLEIPPEDGQKASEERELLLQAYFHLLSLIRTWDHLDEGYARFFVKGADGLVFHLASIDPSRQLAQVYDRVRGAALFSATLSPIEYYKHLLGGGEEDTAVAFPSPFPPENRKVLIAPVRVTYQNRQESIPAICRLIYETVRVRSGHYLVFFPSFAYLEQTVESYMEAYPYEKLLIQQREMDDEERAAFLEKLKDQAEPVTAFGVLGGMFSEGIDLVGESLVGAIIVTVGLPQIGLQRDLMRDHLDRMEDEAVHGRGFEYAYVYPGLSKVLQAAGRVHRTETDRGVILLIDERFAQQRYRRLYPAEWGDPAIVRQESIGDMLKDFWKGTPETSG